MLKKYYGISIPGRYDPQVVEFGKELTKKVLDLKDKEDQELFIINQCQEFLEKLFI